MICFWWCIKFKGMIATIFFYFHFFLSWTKMSLELLITIMRTYSCFSEHYNLLILSNTFIFLHLYLLLLKSCFWRHLWWCFGWCVIVLFFLSFEVALCWFLGSYLYLNCTLCGSIWLDCVVGGVLGLLVQVP